MATAKKSVQVVSVKRDGSLESLQRAKGLDLRKLGEVDITRVSEVMWSKTAQKYYVVFHEASGSPFRWIGTWLWDKIRTGTLTRQEAQSPLKDFGLVYFDEYEQGVAAEIKTLDYLRVNGFLK
jgi:hypothetical protein